MTKITPEIGRKQPEKTGDSPRAEGRLVDLFSRSISYLRVSLTDQCNLRCMYCTPKKGGAKLAPGELLSYEELLRIIELAVGLGIRKVRLTGGEPLVRRNVLSFIRRLAALPGLDDIRLTTNGILLPRYGEELYAAGIRKLNISLDTLKRQRYREITGADRFEEVIRGIELAEKLGFSPIKINMVVMRGVNDDELLDFARLSLSRSLQIRFIEFMPIGDATIWAKDKYMSTEEMMERIAALGPLQAVKSVHMDGPARVFRLKSSGNDNQQGSVGFISPISHKFCDRCNRLRLTSEGRLRSCLLSDKETDLKTILRSGGSDADIEEALVKTIHDKPKGHELAREGGVNCHGQMSRIGG